MPGLVWAAVNIPPPPPPWDSLFPPDRLTVLGVLPSFTLALFAKLASWIFLPGDRDLSSMEGTGKNQ